VVEECARFLGTEYGLLVIKEPSDTTFRLLAATSNIPQSYFHQSFDLQQGLIGWILRNAKPLLIPRLNADSPEHFLLSTRENLPHQGTFWGLPAASPTGFAVSLAFLSRGALEWSVEDRFIVSHMLYYVHLLLEQSYFKEEYRHLQAYDLSSGLLNNLTFEVKVEETLAASMQNSLTFTLALLQLEPWQILHTKAPPGYMRKWQQELAQSLFRAAPARHIVLGQIAENRYGILLSGMTPQEINLHLNAIADVSHQVVPKKIRKIRIQPYISTASFPQDATNTEELWTVAYTRLFEAFRASGD
jgi:GGDEF domain-containing protein